ncbi:MAG: peptidoglycan DD-metalloendopeptidase family protein [Candidatus Binatia bacterium]
MLSERQILAMAEVAGSEVREVAPEEIQIALAGPMIPSTILAARAEEPVARSPRLAMASFLGPPEPMFDRLRRRTEAPSSEFSMELNVDPGELVGPTRERVHKESAPEPEAAAAPAVVVAAAVSPEPAEADLVGPPRPSDVEHADCGYMGPLRPSSLSTDEDAEVVAAVSANHRHGLPFDPLAVGPFLPASAPKRVEPKPNNPFHDFLARQAGPADDDDIHTVAYTHELKHSIRSGETMTEVLSNLGLESKEVDEWITAASRKHNLNRIYAGQALSLAMRMPDKQLASLKLDLAGEEILIAELDEEGRITARREEIVYDRSLRAIGAEIDHSLYMSAQSEGIPDKIVSDIAEILGWDVNFSNVYQGATFRVVYEELTRTDTAQTIPGRVLAVELTNRGKHHEGFYFTMPDGSHAGYYNRAGDGLGRAFLRYPVDYSRISSHFTTKRFHPVLKRNVPHYGVDFAAPTGTPVRAVAAGKVLKAGWYGGNGRFVKVRHDSVYETGYAHLSRIAPSMKPGTVVRKGQIIGYVGSTGLATGPHLHFAMYRDARYIDPLNAELPRSHALDGSALAAFRMTVDMMDRAYAKAGDIDPEMTRIATVSIDVD